MFCGLFWGFGFCSQSAAPTQSKPTQTRLHRARDLNKNLITRQKKLDLEASSSFADVEGPVRNVGGGYRALNANFAVLARHQTRPAL